MRRLFWFVLALWLVPLLPAQQPSGSHFNLNLIGKNKLMPQEVGTDSGHVIFVSLGSVNDAVTTKISLTQGAFAVTDKNGTDGQAGFRLPSGGYSIWARALGKPTGEAGMSTCANDTTAVGQVYCSTEHELFVRSKGKSQFRNVTSALTTIALDPVADSTIVTQCGSVVVGLFAPCLEDYFWKLDNRGLRLLQLRFVREG
jgi:hypothetical protein